MFELLASYPCICLGCYLGEINFHISTINTGSFPT